MSPETELSPTNASRSTVADLRELCRGGLRRSEFVCEYFAKWKSKRRQELLDAVYAATYNDEAGDGGG